MNKEELIKLYKGLVDVIELGLRFVEEENQKETLKAVLEERKKILKHLEQLDEPSEVMECEFKETTILEELFCTSCEKFITQKTFRIIAPNFCPNCGAKIKGSK